MEEIWKDVIGYEGLYQVSNLGNVRSLGYTVPTISDKYSPVGYKGRVLRSFLIRGYARVALCDHGKQRQYSVHRLVAEAFIENPKGYPCINHIDENPSNNCVNNLEWCTYKHNSNHGTAIARSVASKDYAAIGRKQAIPVVQKDLDGNIVRIWDRAKDAAMSLGINIHTLHAVLKGRSGTTAGYKFEYVRSEAS